MSNDQCRLFVHNFAYFLFSFVKLYIQNILNNFGDNVLQFCAFINLPWGRVRSLKKCVPDRFSRFDVYQFQTNKQTSKQSIYIELVFSFGGTHLLCTYIVYMYYVRTLNTCTMYVHCIHVLCTYILYMYYVRTLYT